MKRFILGASILVVSILIVARLGQMTVNGDGMFVLLGTIVVAGIVGIVLFLMSRKLKKSEPALAEIRSKEPVAYFCSYELAGELSIVSANKSTITLWNVSNGHPQEFAKFDKKGVTVKPSKVQVAIMRSVDGAVIESKNEPKTELRLNICQDSSSILMTSKKGADLEEAIQRLNAGK